MFHHYLIIIHHFIAKTIMHPFVHISSLYHFMNHERLKVPLLMKSLLLYFFEHLIIQILECPSLLDHYMIFIDLFILIEIIIFRFHN